MSSENFFAVLQLPPHGTYENLVCKKNLELNLPSLLKIHDNHEKSMKKYYTLLQNWNFCPKKLGPKVELGLFENNSIEFFGI